MKRRLFLLFIFPILLYSSEQKTLIKANNLKLYEKNEWKALLHYNGNFNITDKIFILSNEFSLKTELNSIIKKFYTPKVNYKDINNHPQCKFPSRLLFISHELNLSNSEFPKVNCSDFDTYKKKAPADTISLIYASEKVNNPSSMMGHTLLKYQGKNNKGRKVEHAISFYTLIETINILKLAYQNVFSGMKGLFTLQPYKKILKQYTDKENRNVWEYQLKLSDYRKKLIYYHIWELKSIDMKYFFTSYNCSTVIYYILSLANPKVYDENKLWITPLDTVKFLYKHDLIENSELFPSNEWLIKMTTENLDAHEIDEIKDTLKHKKYNEISKLDYNSLKLLEAYSSVKYQDNDISIEEFKTFKNNIDNSSENNGNIFDISKYKSPNKIPSERQIGIGYSNINEEEFVKLSFLPASHLLNDNNQEYFGESELKIGYLSVLLNKDNIELEEFTLYGMKSYLAYDTLTNDLSYQFELAVKKEYSEDMNYIDTIKIDAGIGIDFLLWHDINIFVMLNLGAGYNKDDNTHIFLNPEIGGMIYEVFNMKSLIYYQPLFINKNKIYDKYVLNHHIFFLKDYKFYFNFEQVNAKSRYENYEFGISKLF
ncbi:MAG: hypothetical protein ACI9TV_001361 [Sulfurimonas sp.]|jgi:hypothetical protein|uniref:Lnb N-terminal periplasmic domain-containing protein n=1 Tax=Sulfurimonas sp. TaxID=2022749 RepID=UPI0039E69D7D